MIFFVNLFLIDMIISMLFSVFDKIRIKFKVMIWKKTDDESIGCSESKDLCRRICKIKHCEQCFIKSRKCLIKSRIYQVFKIISKHFAKSKCSFSCVIWKIFPCKTRTYIIVQTLLICLYNKKNLSNQNRNLILLMNLNDRYCDLS